MIKNKISYIVCTYNRPIADHFTWQFFDHFDVSNINEIIIIDDGGDFGQE